MTALPPASATRERGRAQTGDRGADFAQQCVKLYQDAELWQKLRLNALEQIAQQCSTEYFRETLKQILN